MVGALSNHGQRAKTILILESRKEVLARSEFVIREHQHAGLLANARVCLHTESTLL